MKNVQTGHFNFYGVLSKNGKYLTKDVIMMYKVHGMG